MKLTFGILLSVAALTFAGCTNRSRSVKVEDKPKTGETAKDGTQSGADANSANTAVIETTITAEALQSAALPLGIDATKISKYNFSYLEVTKDGSFGLVGGVARLRIEALPANRSGTVKLIFMQDDKPVLVGEAANVTLKQGEPNNLTLVMRAATSNDVPVNNPNGGGAATTDLNIDVTLDPNSSGTPSSVTNPATSGPSAPSNVAPSNVAPASTDPLPNWNGLEFKGNSRWRIVPVN